ncbi:MAG: hypothetical protein LBL75_01530 [Rickettsiales bacterium]|jgi:hypothetical protein|nr:hypothetical protein [Rickettsiales bacterium]
MKKIAVFFAGFLGLFWVETAFSACSKIAMTDCLDSVCAINANINQGARCQLCGTPSAGTIPGLKSVVASSKNALSAADIKSAPTNPVARYTWAIEKCMEKQKNECGVDDTLFYDDLIEKSCQYAGGAAVAGQKLKAGAAETKTATCAESINTCVSTQCGTGWKNCLDDSALGRLFAGCAVSAGNCDESTDDIYKDIVRVRDNAVNNKDKNIAAIAAEHKSARESKMKIAADNCAGNAGFDACVQSVCDNNMPNKCDAAFPSEMSNANQMCQFERTACERFSR